MKSIRFYEPPKKDCYTLEDGSAFEVDSNYIPIKILGRGASGTVVSSFNQATGEKVAIKKIGDAFGYRGNTVSIIREIYLLKNLHHPNVISLKDVMIPASSCDFNEVYMVYNLMDTDLNRMIRSPDPLVQGECGFFLFQILNGLSYLHSANVLHRDLKPANIFINATYDLTIGDFGLACTASNTGELPTEYVASRWYRAPEVLLCCRSYSAAIDVWSVGCIFAELLGRRPIFPGVNRMNQLELIMGTIGFQSASDLEFIDHPEELKLVESLNVAGAAKFFFLFPEADPLAIDLLSKMLALNPAKRITAEGALRHPYLQELFDPTTFSPARKRLIFSINGSYGERELRDIIMDEIIRCFIRRL